jgi:subtilisin family serine protease
MRDAVVYEIVMRAFTVLVPLVVLAAPASALQSTVSSSDFVVLSTLSGDVVYTLNADDGHVSFLPVPAEASVHVPIDSLLGLLLPGKVHCTAIAARWNRLIFIDDGSGRPVIRELDPNTGAIYEIRTSFPLSKPIAIAASSASGEIAVADERLRATIWLRDQEAAQLVPWPRAVGRLSHLAFDGRDVFALDSESHTVVALPRPGGAAAQALQPARAAAAPIPDLRAFSMFHGVSYLSNGPALFTLAPGGKPRRLACTTCPASVASVLATAQRLFVYDDGRREIAILPRPVPIGFRIETSLESGERALGAFYTYLADRDLLPLRDETTARAFDSAGDAMRAAQVALPLGDGERASLASPLAALLCRVNETECRERPAYWNEPIGAGRKLSVPDFVIESFVHTDTVALNGTPARDHLTGVRDLEGSADLLETVQELNADSFETILARRGYVIASPARGDLVPGSVITLRDGAEQAGQGLAALCGVSVGTIVHPAPLDIPDRVARVNFKDFVPLAADTDGGPKDYQVKDGDEYGISLRRTRVEQLDTAAAAAPANAGRLADCMRKLSPGPSGLERLLITEALRVDGAVYDFYRPPRSVGLRSSLYLAYKAVPVSAFATLSVADALATAAVKPVQLKPGGPQDLLSRKNGSLQLPLRGWSLNAVVPAGDLAHPDSPLHAIERVPQGRILVLPRELIGSAAASLTEDQDDEPPRDLDEPTIAQMKKERKELLDAIGYKEIERESRGEYFVAVGEARNSIDFDHPAMIEVDGQTATSAFWTQPDLNQRFVRHPVAPVVAANPRRRAFTDDHHGAHVAGLIAARESSLLPGLLPKANVFFIDTSNLSVDTFHKSIDQAVRQRVKVFNLSLKFDNVNVTNALAMDLRRDIKNSFPGQLFIIAAGNQGKDLSDSPDPPVGWVSEKDLQAHLIGVGMTTPDGTNFESEYEDENRQTRPASNFGQQFVQLAAPGRNIFSLARENSYTAATGTSQATPQVTAAAVMLSGQYTPNQIKARLIYTADWIDRPGYIWGGRLNVHRAVRYPGRNLYVDKSGTTAPAIAAEFKSEMTITIANPNDARMIESDGRVVPVPTAPIPFGDVLRLTTMANVLYRVHYLDRANGNQLRIIENADVHGTAQFVPGMSTRWNGNEFVDFDPHEDGFDISDFIYDYVARVPDVCQFQPSPCNQNIIF